MFDPRCSTERRHDVLTIMDARGRTIAVRSGRDYSEWSTEVISGSGDVFYAMVLVVELRSYSFAFPCDLRPLISIFPPIHSPAFLLSFHFSCLLPDPRFRRRNSMEIRLRFVRQRMGLVFHSVSRYALFLAQRLAQRSQRPLTTLHRPGDLSARSYLANLQKLRRHLSALGRRSCLLRSVGRLGISR